MRPSTGVREALGRVRVEARGFAKGLHRTRHSSGSGGLDGVLENAVASEDRRDIYDMYGFIVRPQHLEKYLEYDKIYKEEEEHRSNRWKQFLEANSNSGDVESEGGGGESPVNGGDSYWGSLWAVEQALPRCSDGACPWADELKTLVWEGVPVGLRGKLWQVFAGAKDRWVDGKYQEFLARDAKLVKSSSAPVEGMKVKPLEKWASQIEKDLPRTFPGHPILGEDGLGALRRMLTAYAIKNPSVGYCQAMNFLAALLLLFMPEENAFWTLTSIIDDYFEGYYTEKMTEAQVDQLVFTELMREELPNLAKHLDAVEVEISWFSGAWFLSIFVNVLPWESVLRVWDVLLYEGNRSMLFRTALALLEMHAEALIQKRDNGDVLTMLQSMGETIFNSSQLVLSACHRFPNIHEGRLRKLRDLHRRTVIAQMHNRSLDLRQWRASNSAAKQVILDATNGSNSELFRQKTAVDGESLEPQFIAPMGLHDVSSFNPDLSGLKGLNIVEGDEGGTLECVRSAPEFLRLEPLVSKQNGFKSGPYGRIDETDEHEDSKSSGLQEEVSRLRKELDHALQAREEAEFRAEGLKHALTEMDRRRQSPAEMEKLKAQVAHLKEVVADKHEQEAATIQVIMSLEEEVRKADEKRRRAVEDAEESRQNSTRALGMAADDLEMMKKRALAAESMLKAIEQQAAEELRAMEKRAVMAESMLNAIQRQAAEELRAMEKRAVMAESMLEATLSFQSGSTPRTQRGMEPKSEPKPGPKSEPKLELKLKGDEAKDDIDFRNQIFPKLDGDPAWEKKQNVSKPEEAAEHTNFIANKTSKLGRPFPLRDRNKVHAEHNADDTYNQEVGVSTSVPRNSSPAISTKLGNIQKNSTSPELVKLQYIKRRF